MSDLPSVIAVHAVHRNPTKQSTHTGKFHPDGSPVLRSKGIIHAPGSSFTPADQVELDWLLSVNAVRLASQSEQEWLARIHDGETGQ